MREENRTIIKIIESWKNTDHVLNSLNEILEWVETRKRNVNVKIEKISLEETKSWYYDRDELGIVNQSKTFFQVKGLEREESGSVKSQPIIIQNEIGYLGILTKEIDGVLYFLMQAKIEPGNVNIIQISPTLQATKSNFTQAHGGKVPSYLGYFDEDRDYEVIVDQIQSEHSSLFYGKRNRNIIIRVNDEVEVLDTHKWMTLGQIKELMRYDNLVNMDTRTVISCIPFALKKYSADEIDYIETLFNNKSFFNSIFKGEADKSIHHIFNSLNDVKMYDKSNTNIIDLFDLPGWKMEQNEFKNDTGKFKVIFCNIEIDDREVKHWQQPLFEPITPSEFGLIYCVEDGMMKFLVQIVAEVGCFDKVEIGPSVQIGARGDQERDKVIELFEERKKSGKGVVFSGLFSEEGGRFYHAENRNFVIEVEKEELSQLPDGYFWVDYYALNTLVQFNNFLNIQLRNLLSILDL